MYKDTPEELTERLTRMKRVLANAVAAGEDPATPPEDREFAWAHLDYIARRVVELQRKLAAK